MYLSTPITSAQRFALAGNALISSDVSGALVAGDALVVAGAVDVGCGWLCAAGPCCNWRDFGSAAQARAGVGSSGPLFRQPCALPAQSFEFVKMSAMMSASLPACLTVNLPPPLKPARLAELIQTLCWPQPAPAPSSRSEERRVGKECRS